MKPVKQLILALVFLLNISSANAEEPLHSLNFQDADIRLLIETVSDMTKKNFVIDPQVQGKVTVISGHPVSKKEVYNIFLSVLSVHGLAAIKDGNSIKIVSEAEAGGIIGDFDATYDSDFVTQIIKLKYVPASELTTMLKSMNQKAKIIAHKESNLLIISDRAKNVERMINIINRIDKKSDSSIEMITLQHASATEVAQTIESLLDTGNSALTGKTKIVADERTNSVIINAAPSLKLRIQTLIAQLDTPLETNTQSQVIKLKYSEAESLVSILETLANKSQQIEEDGSSSSNQKATIQAHKETNSLVINAPPTIFNNLLNAIEQLDVKRPQVLVEAIIVEITVDHSKEVGFQWQGLLSQLNGEGLVGGTNYGIIGNILNPDGVLNNGANIGYVHIDGEGNPQIGALLSALAANTNNNILSTPSIVTLNNQEATLSVGQEVPFLTGQYTNTGGNDGSTNPFSTIQRKDIGISLTVTPRIYEGNQIVLDIAQEVSSLATSATAVDVITNKRTIQTSVMVPNGGVIVLGGLIDETVVENIKKVPLLGDIPVIRNLFRHKKKTRVKRNLMVFIHPVILDDNNRTTVTNKMYDDIRQQQLNKMNDTEFSKGSLLLPESINQHNDN
ncbi:General secretion pathway protein D [hydrothermal vent metagenome]|uniref:General secretion pathway protein D n=1 Tax=hydrothermal vent metagenome TaxID=652676 RepID=A0A3B0V922_9ZZZZ